KITHIELARWADCVLIAPASAHTLAKLAHGLCDDLLSSLCLATQAPLVLAPAMNLQMWEAPATQGNIATLLSRSVQLLGPDCGAQACGEYGDGRMLEPEAILNALNGTTTRPSTSTWSHKKVVITGGPTREPLDPIRYLSNNSSGHLAYALAQAAQTRGATVTLITGPTQLKIPEGVHAIAVNTAQEMLQAALQSAPGADVFIAAAAVADYCARTTADQKIKKSSQSLHLELIPTPDVLLAVSKSPQRPKLVIGFAAETSNVIQQAQEKLTRKGLDAIIANQVGTVSGFGDLPHEATFLVPGKAPIVFPKTSKAVLANNIIEAIEGLWSLADQQR
ncbi:MAG TPA: bifunctional phosphopantothenoylcysteine decarboxylase/phosphopantothenate--cysteine ligase CoaBC, partial [Opitutales bacterium]|nr:bifunctional phosphopantothenoylcysteine decarboxylase/phosphopantothenate--cysteine ligase CoaBC [Opitutales bacterium]